MGRKRKLNGNDNPRSSQYSEYRGTKLTYTKKYGRYEVRAPNLLGKWIVGFGQTKGEAYRNAQRTIDDRLAGLKRESGC